MDSSAPRDSQKTPFGRAHSRFSVMSSAWWKNWESADAGFLMGLMLPLPAVPIELALWGIDSQIWSSLDFLGSVDGRWIPLFLGGVLPLNGLLVDRLLMRKNRQDERLRPWVRCLRFCVAAVPFMGLFVAGIWKRITRHSPAWAFAPENGPDAIALRNTPDGQDSRSSLFLSCSRMLDRWVRRLEGSGWWVGWMFILNMALLLQISTWTVALKPIPQGRRAIAIGLTTALHLAAFLGIVQYTTRLAKKFYSPALQTPVKMISAGWLIPLPGLPLLLLVSLIGLEERGSRMKTLTSAAYLPRQSANRLEAWNRLLKASQSSRRWSLRGLLFEGSARQPGPGVQIQRLRIFFRAKTLLLAFDGICLGFGSASLARAWPPVWPWMRGVLLLGGLLCAIIALLACLAALREFVARLRRPSQMQDSSPFSSSSYLAFGVSAMLIGLIGGVCLGFEQIRAMGIVLALLPGLACMLGGFGIMSRPIFPPKPGSESLLSVACWCLSPLLVSGSGLLLFLTGGINQWTNLAAVFAAALIPLSHIALASAFLGWLLRPFRFKDQFSSKLHIQSRRPLWAMTATAVLPLGGLAVPWWVRFRRKRWPEYQKLWAGLNQGRGEEGGVP